MCVLTHPPVPTGTSSQHVAASKHSCRAVIRHRQPSRGALRYCSRPVKRGRQNERNGWNTENISLTSCLLPTCFHLSKLPAREFRCPGRAQPPPLCGRRSPTTHLLDLNLYGHSRPTQFPPSCSLPHREQPLSPVEEVDKFDLLPEESSPLWWWLIVPRVTKCPHGIHRCRLDGDERIFFFFFRGIWPERAEGWPQHMRLCSCHSSIIALRLAWGQKVLFPRLLQYIFKLPW